jgi:hypothetical protein
MKKCLLLALLIACSIAQRQKIKKYNNKKFSKKTTSFQFMALKYILLMEDCMSTTRSCFFGYHQRRYFTITVSADKNRLLTFNKVDSFALSIRITGEPIDYIATVMELSSDLRPPM